MMLPRLVQRNNFFQLFLHQQQNLLPYLARQCQSCSEAKNPYEIERLVRVINDHAFPDLPLQPTFRRHVPQTLLTTSFVENVLGGLFAAHTNGLKAYEFFRFSLLHPHYEPSSDAFEKTLHILTRMRYFDKAWELMDLIQNRHPHLLTNKSMSIMLSRVAKFLSYEDTLEAFEKMENDIFRNKEFGIDEFNVLLRAFSTQRQMKEAKSVFNKFHSRFSPTTKTMNILLLGFKETGNLTAVELFYHEMYRRGFKPNEVTYSIRIDAFCKNRYLGDALRLFDEMEQSNLFPTLETMTTLIHGAGIARNITKAKELFNEITSRNLEPDIGAYNALISSLIKCRDANSALALMREMEGSVGLDYMTYHTVFWGLIRSKRMESVLELYWRMIAKGFVPKSRTVVMLMKCFCQNDMVDLGLNLWKYLVEKGHCPHGHALDLLVTSLCSRGRVEEAFECSKQILERGRHLSNQVFEMLQRLLLHLGEVDKLQNLDNLIKKLLTVLPASTGHSTGNC